jgi:hypothetical protein
MVSHTAFLLGDRRAWYHLRRLLRKGSLKRHEFKYGDNFLTNISIAKFDIFWPCIIMYHNNVTNVIHFHFNKHFIVS